MAEVESEIPDITNSTKDTEDTADIITTFIAIYYFIIITTLDARIKEGLKSLSRKK